MFMKTESIAEPKPRTSSDRQRGYFDRSEPTRQPSEGAVLKFADKIAVLMIKGTISVRDGARVREEMCLTLMKQFGIGRSRAQRLIDLAKENIHFRCYGRYKRNPVEMKLLIAQAAGTVGDVSAN